MTQFKSTKQQATEIIEKGNVKEIMEQIFFTTEVGEMFLILIKENSNDFTADIAKKTNAKILNASTDYNAGRIQMSQKQAWCCAYQIHNNKEVYVIAAKDFS